MRDNIKWENTFPEVPKSFHDKVNATLMHLPDGKEQNMSRQTGRFSWKKGVAIAAVATMILGTTVFAAGRIASITSFSSSQPTFTDLPTADQAEEKIGISPKLVESFGNGFAFEDAVVVDGALNDESGNAQQQFKELDLTYEKEGSQIVLGVKDASITEMMENDGEEPSPAKETTDYQGTALDYISYANKLVPADYEMTEEDKAAQESGELVFSYGAPDVSVSSVQNLTWEEDGVSYFLLTMDDSVTKSDLVSMAQELIDLA